MLAWFCAAMPASCAHSLGSLAIEARLASAFGSFARLAKLARLACAFGSLARLAKLARLDCAFGSLAAIRARLAACAKLAITLAKAGLLENSTKRASPTRLRNSGSLTS